MVTVLACCGLVCTTKAERSYCLIKAFKYQDDPERWNFLNWLREKRVGSWCLEKWQSRGSGHPINGTQSARNFSSAQPGGAGSGELKGQSVLYWSLSQDPPPVSIQCLFVGQITVLVNRRHNYVTLPGEPLELSPCMSESLEDHFLEVEETGGNPSWLPTPKILGIKIWLP